MSDSTFDPFGFLNSNFNIFGRVQGAWLEGPRPFAPAWPSGSAQFNHNLPIETANNLQILRDFYYLKGADGQPLFDPYSFTSNGRVLPTNPANAPTVGAGVAAYSVHENGYVHDPLKLALNSDGWFGKVNADWEGI